MLTIDGGDGGGQVLRTALTLSVVTDTPFRIEAIRGNRPNPGLAPQHLAAVRLVADRADAEVSGAELGADSLTFRPGGTRRSSLSAEVGTAGSVTLLFDTLLPMAATAADPIEATATGGTDVKWAPTVGYQRRVKVPLLARFGVDAAVDPRRTGFYPAGGGKATLRTAPSSLSPVELPSRGGLQRVEIHSKASGDLAEQEVAARQATAARRALESAGHPVEVRSVAHVETASTGSSLLLRGVYEGSLAGFDALGERGRPSEEVAAGAVEAFEAFHDGGGAVDAHMADQVIPFLALAGGRVRVPAVTSHVETNLAVVERFGADVRLERTGEGAPVLSADPHPAVG